MEERFWSKVDASGPCWLWTAGVGNHGYGTYNLSWRDGRPRGLVLAHRHAWESLVGPIAQGLVLDHLCRVRVCVNTDHLEPVTQAENVRRGYSYMGMCQRRNACLKGDHPLDGLLGNGRRYCKTCAREREWRKRRDAGIAQRKAGPTARRPR